MTGTVFENPKHYPVGVHLLENRDTSNPVHVVWSEFEAATQPNPQVYGYGESMHTIPDRNMPLLADVGYLDMILSLHTPYLQLNPTQIELILFGRAPGGCLNRHLYALAESEHFQGSAKNHIFKIAVAMHGIPFRRDNEIGLFERELDIITQRFGIPIRKFGENEKLNVLRRV
jgi:hypothetical protein